ncbi:TPA: TetR/AcrR family transcriptional regulator, partial [Escherichia albertii]|nr:TetR/AcrR family transcriptional regulator [Escherichia albertii]HAH3044979.1 TetR/AcrR family transcriptional regulator [Escherichia albertii]HAH3053866.1 TetR/AcrR family transcriptional regulator [Escherichia albertii]
PFLRRLPFSRLFLSPEDREPLCHLKNCIPH